MEKLSGQETNLKSAKIRFKESIDSSETEIEISVGQKLYFNWGAGIGGGYR